MIHTLHAFRFCSHFLPILLKFYASRLKVMTILEKLTRMVNLTAPRPSDVLAPPIMLYYH